VATCTEHNQRIGSYRYSTSDAAEEHQAYAMRSSLMNDAFTMINVAFKFDERCATAVATLSKHRITAAMPTATTTAADWSDERLDHYRRSAVA
jgi:hypothetical protein